MGAQQPSGVAQHPQNTPMQKVVGHVCIHSSQRVIKEIEGFLLDRMNTAGTMAPVFSRARRLSQTQVSRQSDMTGENSSTLVGKR